MSQSIIRRLTGRHARLSGFRFYDLLVHARQGYASRTSEMILNAAVKLDLLRARVSAL